MKRVCAARPYASGFSFVEMLTSIAIIGIICSIAVLALNYPQREAIADAARRQNAATLASVAFCLEVAGASPVIPNDLEGTIRRLAKGIIPADGPLVGQRFVVSGIEDAEVPAIAKFLSIETGELIYHEEPAAIQPGG